MERRDPDASSPKMCAWVARVGSSGILMLHVCVDCMLALFDSSTVINMVVRLELTIGIELKNSLLVLSSSRKCPVIAVSATMGFP